MVESANVHVQQMTIMVVNRITRKQKKPYCKNVLTNIFGSKAVIRNPGFCCLNALYLSQEGVCNTPLQLPTLSEIHYFASPNRSGFALIVMFFSYLTSILSFLLLFNIGQSVQIFFKPFLHAHVLILFKPRQQFSKYLKSDYQ